MPEVYWVLGSWSEVHLRGVGGGVESDAVLG